MLFKDFKFPSSSKANGIILSAIASISFGFIPLFSLPLMNIGIKTPSILFYRFIIASIFMAFIIFYKKINLKINLQEGILLILLGVLYIFSSLGLQLGYLYMSSGVATVIHFTYPVFVVLLLLILFKEYPSKLIILSIIMAFIGVLFISKGDEETNISIKGFLIVLSTGLTYATYMIIVNKSILSKMNNLKISFYVLTFCGISFFIMASFSGGIQILNDKNSVINALLLAIIPTVISNIMLIEGVKKCGSTLSSILGALEPFTAVIIGFLVFNEKLSAINILGIVLIFTMIIIIALSKKDKNRPNKYI